MDTMLLRIVLQDISSAMGDALVDSKTVNKGSNDRVLCQTGK